MKRKYELSEKFIGWKSDDGLLEVIGIADSTGQAGRKLFKVICYKCSKSPKWKDWQYLVIARRVGEKKGFIVNGFADEFHGVSTKLHLECLVDGYKWTASIASVINSGRGCSKCSNKYKPTEQEAFDKCKEICETEGYEPIGFPNGYKNNQSRFEYKCSIHGIRNVSYNSFTRSESRRCKGCWAEKQKERGNLYGYYPERKDEVDYLYVLNFNDKFIKVGRSFYVDERIGNLKKPSESGIKNIKKLRIFTATHQEIYDLEQELHSELRERGFQHDVDWSTECFEKDCIYGLNNLLDNCGLLEVFIE